MLIWDSVLQQESTHSPEFVFGRIFMVYIEKIRVQNFQVHKDSVFELSDGVNVIAGPSRSGKSSLIRALKWLLFNRASGDFHSDFVSEEEETSVRIWLSNGISIERFKNKQHNGYRLWKNPEVKEPVEFRAIRRDVPKEISAILKVDEVNFQEQIRKPYFIIEDTPGQITRRFNKLSGLEAMDEASTMANQAVLKIRREIEALNDSIDEVKAEIEETSWVEEVQNIYEECCEIKSLIDSIDPVILSIQQTLSVLSSLDKEIESCKAFVEIDFRDIDNLIQTISNIDERLAKGRKYLTAIETVGSRIREAKRLIRLKEETTETVALFDKIKYIDSSIEAINKRMKAYNSLKEEMVKLNRIINENKEKIVSFMGEIDICPLCNSQLLRE